MPPSTTSYSKEPADILEPASEPLAEDNLHSDLRSDSPLSTPGFTVDSVRSLGLQLSFVYDKSVPAPVRSFEVARPVTGKVYDDTVGRTSTIQIPAPSHPAE
jgi:hypothetical protein